MPNSLETVQFKTILHGLDRGNQLVCDKDGHFYACGMGTKPATIYETSPEEIRRRVREFVDRNKELLEPELLNELQEKLAGRLNVLSRNTSGFFALLCFLFSFDRGQFWDNKQLDDKAYLADFRALLERAMRELRQPSRPIIPTATIITPPTPSKPVPPRQLQIVTHPNPTFDLFEKIDSTGDESPPQPSSPPSPPTPPPSPTTPPNPPTPPPTPTNQHSADTNQPIQLPPPSIIPPPSSIIPSPPSQGIGNTPPPTAPVLPGFEALFPGQSDLTKKPTRLPPLAPMNLKDEPVAPACLSEKFSHLPPEDIEKQKTDLETYCAQLEAALLPIKNCINRHAQLVKERDEENTPHIAALEKTLQVQQKNLDSLKEAATSGSFISLYHPNAELPFIPDNIFDEIQSKIAEHQADPSTRNFKILRLSNNYRISKAIECTQRYMAELTVNMERYKTKNAELATQITDIENSSNNGIPFARFKAVVNAKETAIRKARTQASSRNNHLKGKVTITLPTAPTITTEHPIFKEYPRLRPLDSLPQPLVIAMQTNDPTAIFAAIKDNP